MAIPTIVSKHKGSWVGKSKLNLSHLPPDQRLKESNSRLHIDLDDNETFATVTYVWDYEGKKQEGSMHVCMDSKTKAVQVGWVDSWHQSTAVMHLKGEAKEDGSFKTKGDWSAGDEVWGWTIGFVMAEEKLVMKMEVVTPTGEADWAVEAAYSRE